MSHSDRMIQLETAVTQILAAVPPPVPEETLLSEANGRVLLEAVHANHPLPRFDNSAMDGFAVQVADIKAATPQNPAVLRVVARVTAGQSLSEKLTTGTCARIFTGAPLPNGADGVVMQEDTRRSSNNPENIKILASAKPWENVRFCGEDVKPGQELVSAGSRLNGNQLGLLAACGCNIVKVGRPPTIALMATGTELCESNEQPGAGKIYESNRVMLAAHASELGASPIILPLVRDNFEETRRALINAFNTADIVISTGGVSVGDTDFVKSAFEAEGGKLEFWKVAIKPGRPFVFGRLGQKLLFGLPGNPVSALVTFLLLVRPALLKWQGTAKTDLSRQPGYMAETLVNTGGRRHFFRVRIDENGEVSSSGLQASHMLASLAASNSLLDVAPETRINKGEKVQVLTWQPY
jgi:molybdopterin molybdotransferase